MIYLLQDYTPEEDNKTEEGEEDGTEVKTVSGVKDADTIVCVTAKTEGETTETFATVTYKVLTYGRFTYPR